MKKVLVIGSGGAGKSTLAAQLGPILCLPVFHLDRLHWKPGWVKPDREAWNQTVSDLVTRDEWVIDGNYGGSLHIRFPAADTIIYLDFPPLLCLSRVIKRRYQYRNRSRPDIASECYEKLNLEFLMWVWNFRRDSKPRILGSIKQFWPAKNVITLKNPGQAANLLAEFRESRRDRPVEGASKIN